jgi:hypothetical protein
MFTGDYNMLLTIEKLQDLIKQVIKENKEKSMVLTEDADSKSKKKPKE